MAKPYKCGCEVESPNTCKMCQKRATLRARRKANPGSRVEESQAYWAKNGSELNAKARARYAADPTLKKIACSKHHRNSGRFKLSGHSAEYFALMWAEQDGKCSICERSFTESGSTRPAADHNHATQKPRGILCLRCNSGLGWLEHSLTGKMLEYLEKWADKHLGDSDAKELQ